MDSNVQSAMLLAQSAAPKIPAPTGNVAKAVKSAKEFESVFISQFLGSMFSGISTDGPTGGGQGEEMFRSMMVDQYAKGIEGQGGFGIASQMKAELLKHQQAAAPRGSVQ